MRSSIMFCVKNVLKNPDYIYWDFFGNPLSVEMCGHSKDSVIQVIVQETEESPTCYWAWWNIKDEKFNFVFPKKFLVEMCFPYAIENYEKRGDGKLMPVKILEVLR